MVFFSFGSSFSGENLEHQITCQAKRKKVQLEKETEGVEIANLTYN